LGALGGLGGLGSLPPEPAEAKEGMACNVIIAGVTYPTFLMKSLLDESGSDIAGLLLRVNVLLGLFIAIPKF
jgi:hypothetical protein